MEFVFKAHFCSASLLDTTRTPCSLRGRGRRKKPSLPKTTTWMYANRFIPILVIICCAQYVILSFKLERLWFHSSLLFPCWAAAGTQLTLFCTSWWVVERLSPGHGLFLAMAASKKKSFRYGHRARCLRNFSHGQRQGPSALLPVVERLLCYSSFSFFFPSCFVFSGFFSP